MSLSTAPSCAIIDLDLYAANLALIRGDLPASCQICAVVKANAYGHGAVPVARRAVHEGVSMLSVATIPEGAELRRAGIESPILLMVQPLPDCMVEVVEYGLTPMLTSPEAVDALDQAAAHAGKRVCAHVKIDTGMGRQGFLPEEFRRFLPDMMRFSHIEWDGVATHYPVSEDANDEETVVQTELFRKLLAEAQACLQTPLIAHAANSGAIINQPEAAFDMVRPGILAYGICPCEAPRRCQAVRPVLRWETRVSTLKTLPSGSSIGYGRTYTAAGHERVAVLPVGYADGYRTSLANRSWVIIRGVRRPLRGRVSMDQIVVDVSAPPCVEIGDTATLIGQDGEEQVTADELARLAGTIAYDILTGIGPRVERRYSPGPPP